MVEKGVKKIKKCVTESMYDSMDYSLFISILIDSVVLHYKTKFCWPAYDRKVSVSSFLENLAILEGLNHLN